MSTGVFEVYTGVTSVVCQEFTAHGTVLEQGVSLLRAVSVGEALSGSLPLCETSRSCEREFLSDFINCSSETSAARLATYATYTPGAKFPKAPKMILI